MKNPINMALRAVFDSTTASSNRLRITALIIMLALGLMMLSSMPAVLWASTMASKGQSMLWFMRSDTIETVRAISFVIAALCILSALFILTLFEPVRLLSVLAAIASFMFYVWLALQTYWTFLVTLPYLLVSYIAIRYLTTYEVHQHFFNIGFSRQLKPSQRRVLSILETFSSHAILFIAILIATFPVIWVISTSLRPGELLIDTELKILPERITFDHYYDVIYVENFGKYLINSLVCAGGTTLLAIFLASTCAYALSKFDFRGKKGVLMSFIVVQMFPGVIIIVPYFILLKYLGLLNNYLGLIAAYSVTALPLCVWMIKGFFDTVPDDLIEAARVDGYSHFQIFWRIILPLAKPAIAVTALFSFIAAWNEYVLAYTFMLDQEYYTLPVKIYMYIGSAERWGAFSAMSVLVSIPVVILFIVFQKYLISGMTKGAVKG